MTEENNKQVEEVKIPVEEAVLPQPGSLVLSTSPHVHDGETISGIMLKVLICLMPVVAASVVVFGFNAVRVIVYCTVFCAGLEYLWNVCTRQPQTVRDLSAVVTGVILALNLPSMVPWWICLVGSFFAIIIAKEVFGGLGQNPFNPAAVGRVALLVGFAGYMTQWAKPMQDFMQCSDLETGATPLGMAKGIAASGGSFETLESSDALWQSFVGNIGGSLGETSALAVLLGGIMLIAFRLIKWEIPVAMIGASWIFTWLVSMNAPELTPGPNFHILSGGLMLGAFFMATDMVTSPISKNGAWIFGALIGIIACVIRIWGGYPEGVSFAIVIANALVPLIDRFCLKRPIGWSPASTSALNMRRGEVK